jgi:OOP family OmpA-OmpF porin
MRKVVTRSLPALVLAAACVAAAPAYAQRAPDPGTGFYVGGAVGGVSYNVNTGSLASAGFVTTGTDDTDIAWNLTAGYKFTRNWAVEVGYVDLGTFTADGRFGGATSRLEADVTGVNVSGVGTLPLNDMFSVYGKLGYFRSQAKATANVAGSVGRAKSRENDVTAGIGARYHINRNLSALLEVNYYGLGGSDNATAYMVGARYDF